MAKVKAETRRAPAPKNKYTQVLKFIRERELLSGLQLRIYELLAEHGRMTAVEIWQHLRHDKSHGLTLVQSIPPRLNELFRYGAVDKVDKRIVSDTGASETVWEVTGALPVKRQRHKAERIYVQRIGRRTKVFTELTEKERGLVLTEFKAVRTIQY